MSRFIFFLTIKVIHTYYRKDRKPIIKKFKSIQQSHPGRGNHYKAISLNLTFKNSKSQKPPRQGQKNSALPCLHLEAWLICLGYLFVS